MALTREGLLFNVPFSDILFRREGLKMQRGIL